MTKVSRFKLTHSQVDSLSQRMASAIASLPDVKKLRLFFDDLLTSTEKIMLGKRLFIALLLERGFSYADISSIVKVGQGTIHAVNERFHRGGDGLRLAIVHLEKEEKAGRVIEKIFSSVGKFARPLTSKTSRGYYLWKYPKTKNFHHRRA